MAIRYYDEAIISKLRKWVPDGSTLRVLGPDEVERLFEMKADDTKDKALTLPMIALSRNRSIELLSNIKQDKSFRGFVWKDGEEALPQEFFENPIVINAIPITTTYQLDIYAKQQNEVEEYVREYLFKLINNPSIIIDFPYRNLGFRHIANLRVLSNVSDTSDVSVHLFKGQFYRWTIQIELQDGFLFDIPVKRSWRIVDVDLDLVENNFADRNYETEHVLKIPVEGN